MPVEAGSIHLQPDQETAGVMTASAPGRLVLRCLRQLFKAPVGRWVLFLILSVSPAQDMWAQTTPAVSSKKKTAQLTPPAKAQIPPKANQAVISASSPTARTVQPPAADTSDFLDQGVLENGEDSGLGISGMMNDETVTKFGHEFFEAFVKAWKPLAGVIYNLRIGERYDPLRGSLIHVMINNNSVYEGFLTPRQEAIEELATQLSHELRAALKNRVPIDEEVY